MAVISLIAMRNALGPEVPSELSARLKERDWPGGGKTKALVLSIGADTIEVWPADSHYMRLLGEKLIKLSEAAEDH